MKMYFQIAFESCLAENIKQRLATPADCAIKVPASSVEAYKSATNWSARADYIVVYEEVMIVKEFYKTRKDGVNLFRTYSGA